MTHVDHHPTTAPLDFQTNPDQRSIKSDSSRRSVRSGRGTIEAAPVHWIWPVLLCMTLIVGAFFVLPFYVVSSFAVPDEKDYHEGRLLGASQSNRLVILNHLGGSPWALATTNSDRVRPDKAAARCSTAFCAAEIRASRRAPRLTQSTASRSRSPRTVRPGSR